MNRRYLIVLMLMVSLRVVDQLGFFKSDNISFEKIANHDQLLVLVGHIEIFLLSSDSSAKEGVADCH